MTPELKSVIAKFPHQYRQPLYKVHAQVRVARGNSQLERMFSTFKPASHGSKNRKKFNQIGNRLQEESEDRQFETSDLRCAILMMMQAYPDHLNVDSLAIAPAEKADLDLCLAEIDGPSIYEPIYSGGLAKLPPSSWLAELTAKLT